VGLKAGSVGDAEVCAKLAGAAQSILGRLGAGLHAAPEFMRAA
jgi:hypothetical protein